MLEKHLPHIQTEFFINVPVPRPVVDHAGNVAANVIENLVEQILGKPLFLILIVVGGTIFVLFSRNS